MSTLAVRIAQSIRIRVRGRAINSYIIHMESLLFEMKMGILPTLHRISFDLSYENLVVNGDAVHA